MTTVLMEPVAPWLRDFSRYFGGRGAATPFIPPADVLVDEESVTIHMDIPGVRRDNLDIELENDVLTVRGERPYPYAAEDEGQRAGVRIERGFGRFERDLRVPRGLDPDSIEASLVDGVLTMCIPKPEPAKPRRIEIKGEEARELESASA